MRIICKFDLMSKKRRDETLLVVLLDCRLLTRVIVESYDIIIRFLCFIILVHMSKRQRQRRSTVALLNHKIFYFLQEKRFLRGWMRID